MSHAFLACLIAGAFIDAFLARMGHPLLGSLVRAFVVTFLVSGIGTLLVAFIAALLVRDIVALLMGLVAAFLVHSADALLVGLVRALVIALLAHSRMMNGILSHHGHSVCQTENSHPGQREHFFIRVHGFPP